MFQHLSPHDGLSSSLLRILTFLASQPNSLELLKLLTEHPDGLKLAEFLANSSDGLKLAEFLANSPDGLKLAEFLASQPNGLELAKLARRLYLAQANSHSPIEAPYRRKLIATAMQLVRKHKISKPPYFKDESDDFIRTFIAKYSSGGESAA